LSWFNKGCALSSESHKHFNENCKCSFICTTKFLPGLNLSGRMHDSKNQCAHPYKIISLQKYDMEKGLKPSRIEKNLFVYVRFSSIVWLCYLTYLSSWMPSLLIQSRISFWLFFNCVWSFSHYIILYKHKTNSCFWFLTRCFATCMVYIKYMMNKPLNLSQCVQLIKFWCTCMDICYIKYIFSYSNPSVPSQ
jgi:hypothetical protein